MKEGFEPRKYQEALFEDCKDQNALVVLPTGLGKTIVAAMLIDKEITHEGKKALFLAPTKPLVEQHVDTMRDFIPRLSDWTMKIDGGIKPEKRQRIFEMNDVLCATPQTIRNDARDGRIDLSDVGLLIFDEAHRGTGKYAYTQIAEMYQEGSGGHVVAFTASPGEDVKSIKEIMENLYVDALTYKTRDDADVEPYTHEVDMAFIEVELKTGIREVKNFLDTCFENRINRALKLGYLKSNRGATSRKVLLKYMKSLQAKLRNGEKHHRLFQTMSLIAQALKLQHALQLVETQGLKPLLDYFNSLEEEAESGKTKAAKKLVEDGYFQAAKRLTENLIKNVHEHPKMTALRRIVEKQVEKKESSKIIVFTQYRDSAHNITEMLEETGVSTQVFLGQAKKKRKGLTQDEQAEILQTFREEAFNCLVSTSVGEEGLDIPQVDLVVFFEPVPSAIRSVQRRGRTGRQRAGRVITLITKDTRDEGIRWAAHHKEKRMKNALAELSGRNEEERPEKSGLSDFVED